MARLPRLVIPHQVHFVMQRGLHLNPVFRDADDYRAMLAWLREGARKFKVAIHAYALMPDYWCFLGTPVDEEGLGKLMQWVGRYYVPYFNQKYARGGTLWQGRYKATVIEADRFLILCTRFIETAHERDGLASSGEVWSSYAHHAGHKQDGLITEHALYWALGNTPFDREVAYRSLALQGLGQSDIDLFANAATKSWALGSEKFKNELEKLAGRRVAPQQRGRPSRAGATKFVAKRAELAQDGER